MTRSELLKQTASRLGFKSPKALSDYLLAVASQMATNQISITNVDGKRITLSPTDKVLKKT